MPELTPKLSKQHAVPQHIAAFEFKLIGDLTIKQFLFAGVGIAVAYAAWVSNLNFLVKWGIILTSAGLGLGTAFFPLQDRTLDQWILNFILAIFSPTQRYWQKEPLPPEYLREDYSRFLTSQVLSMTPVQSRRRLQQYLGELEKTETATAAEEEFIEKLNFDLPLPSRVETATKGQPPALEEERGLPKRKEVPEKPKLASEVNIALEKTYKVPDEKETKYMTTLRNVTPGRKIRLPTIEGTIMLKPKEKPRPLPDRRPPLPRRQASLAERKIPAPTPKEPIRELIKENGRAEQLQRQNIALKNRLEEAEKQLKSLTELKKERSKDEAYNARLLDQERKVQKLTKQQKPVPTPKEAGKKIPNIISGVVKDREGKLLENIVVIIKDQDGDPVRALKTNKLGQFAISTPLENGGYTVEVSSKEKHFGIMNVVTNGSVLSAIELKEENG